MMNCHAFVGSVVCNFIDPSRRSDVIMYTTEFFALQNLSDDRTRSDSKYVARAKSKFYMNLLQHELKPCIM